jgi:hypothetical protein
MICTTAPENAAANTSRERGRIVYALAGTAEDTAETAAVSQLIQGRAHVAQPNIRMVQALHRKKRAH